MATSQTINVSVVIPAYNESKLIGKTLDSLLKQDFDEEFEVIVVDNNSTDDTPQQVKSYQAELNNLKLIQEKKQGIASARNKGFKTAQGEIVASTDSDEILPTQWLTTMVKTLRSDEKIVACFGRYRYSDKSWSFNQFSLFVFFVADVIGMLISGTFGLRAGNSAIKKSAWEKVGGFNEQLKTLEDIEITMRLKKFGRVVYLPNLITATTFRRFEGRLVSQIVHKLGSYFSIVFTKSKITTDPGQFR